MEIHVDERPLTQLRDACHAGAQQQGFYDQVHTAQDNYHHTNQQLLHLAIEVGELANHFRKAHVLDAEEAADVLIVLLDLCGFARIDIAGAVTAKMAKNAARARRYGVK